MIKINKEIVEWLRTHGDRKVGDLGREGGWFVLMADGYGGMNKVYLPFDKKGDSIKEESL